MDNTSRLVVAMAKQCRRIIRECDKSASDLPTALQPKHLLWMCKMIEEHAEDSPATKVNRWIGFVQAGMLANRMVDMDGLKTMFDEAKRADSASSEDLEDLTDHLDPESSFVFDIGGEG